MNRSSKNRLTEKELFLFPKETLHDKVGRVVCKARCLPRKEFFESWEVARRVRRRFRGGRVVDLACGHGLTALLLLLLDDSSPQAIAVDNAIPPSAAALYQVIVNEWPRLEGRIKFQSSVLEDTQLTSDDLVVSVHACGRLTDAVIELAVAASSRLAVLPCCHDLGDAETGDLDGWLDGPMAVDITRANSLKQKGYRIFTHTIPEDITPKNRLLMAEPC